MTTAIKAQRFTVKGIITIPFKQQIDGSDILRLEADLIVGNKSHFLIADQDIIVSNGTLQLPLEFTARAETSDKALIHAYSILSGLEKVNGKMDIKGKKKRFTSTGAKVEWRIAE
ncbi:hypothetical protein [Paenibacillus thailandensis]|uniref:Uncharacterized protein n=1 Tax=Paenibacillus thailandensis TaxID=393250 RepID=A0ABW5R2K4_9BACL